MMRIIKPLESRRYPETVVPACAGTTGSEFSFARATCTTQCRLLYALVTGAFLTATSMASDMYTIDKDADAIAALTRPVSKIEIGAGYLSDRPLAASNDTGLDRQGSFVIGNVELRGDQYSYGNPGDDKTRRRLIGSNLGLSSRSLSGEYGRQGKYRVTFGYDEIPRLASDSYQTPFFGAGSAQLTLPPGFVRDANTGGMSALAASLRRFDVESRRRRAEIGIRYWLTPEWELAATLRNDDRDGTKIRGAEFGSNGGNPRQVSLPEPIDSSTQLIDASIAFGGDTQRFALAYHGSLFRNHISSITWQNPYSNAPWVGGASGLPADFPLESGQTGVAPDNQFHQLAASGSYDFSSSTRLTVAGTRGRMTQNEVFLPYTINPGLTGTALPRTSLNGRVETTFLSARLSMRPLRNLNLHASLRYEDRDNQTPQAQYIYVGGDIQLQPPAGSNSDRIRTNLPRSRRHEQLSMEADYRLSATTAIKAGWDYDEIKRTFAEVERSAENTWRLELRYGATGPWTAHASYAQLMRRGSQYLYNLPFLASYTSAAYIDGLAKANGCMVLIDCIRNPPLQNKFFLADRDRERARLLIGYLPAAAISLQGRLDVNRDRYPHSPYGVTEARSWSVGADLGYALSDEASATLFYSFDDRRSRERSRQIVTANTAVASSADADWLNQLVDQTSSIGAGVRYQGLLGGRLELNADVIAVRGRTPISTSVGPAVQAAQNPAGALPDLSAHADHINVNARYAADRHSTVRVNYFYRRFNSADWAYQQVGATILPNAIGTIEISAKYAVHGVGISWIRRFR